MYVQGSAIVLDCNIHDNFTSNELAQDFGAGIYFQSVISEEKLTLVSCTVAENHSSDLGGGIFADVDGEDAALELLNCLVVANGVTDDGGGIFFQGGEGAACKVTNCTFSGNSAVDDGGGLLYWDSDATCTGTIYNSIFWENSAVDGDEIEMRNGDLEVHYSNVRAGWTGVGNNNLPGDVPDDDPNFDGDYRLQCHCTSINRGLNAAIPLDEHDVNEDGLDDGDSQLTPDEELQDRILFPLTGVVDLGAYETDPDYPACRGDITGASGPDGVVDVDDLLLVINSWGECPAPCPADNALGPCPNGIVETDDLLEVINNWGECDPTPSSPPEFIWECFEICETLEGEDWQKCMTACINEVCNNNPSECEE
jgi:hypothetical protein